MEDNLADHFTAYQASETDSFDGILSKQRGKFLLHNTIIYNNIHTI